MKRIILGAGAVIALITLLVTGGASLAQASTVRHTAAYRTCKAFTAWEKRPTAGRLNTMMRDSVYAPWHPLGVDVVVLFTDVREGDHFDQPADKAAIAGDCRTVRY